MKINELDKQITSSDLEALETFADRIFGKVGIDVEFTRHFLDRVNDKRNGEQITGSELTRLFKQEYKRWGKPIAQMGPDAEAVMKDLATDINMPFALRWDRENDELDLIVKTVMRKKDFKTSNKEFTVEKELDEIAPLIPIAGAVAKTVGGAILRNPKKSATIASIALGGDSKKDKAAKALGILAKDEEELSSKKLKEDTNKTNMVSPDGNLRAILSQYVDTYIAKGWRIATRKDIHRKFTEDKDSLLECINDLTEWSWRQPFKFPRPDVIGTKVSGDNTIPNIGVPVKTIELPISGTSFKGKLNGSKKSKKNDKKLNAVKEKQEKKEDGPGPVKGFDPKTARALMMLKTKYPQADNILSALLADVEDKDKESDTADLEHELEMKDITKALDALQKEINLLKGDKKYSFNEESTISTMNKEDPNNPEIHIQGYGVVTLSGLEKSIARMIQQLAEMAKQGNWDSINHNINKGLLQTKLQAVIDTREDLQRIRKKGGTRSRGITKESLFDILIGEDKMIEGSESPFDALARKYQVALHKRTYARAAEVLHTMLQRKYKENDGKWRHSFNWYVAKIADGFTSVKSSVLEPYYLENYETAFITESGGVGKVVPGVNTTVDVGPDEIKKQAKKFGNDVDKNGVPKKTLR